MNKIIYLAIPYTWNADTSFEIANEVSAKLMSEGYIVFSPISQSHVIANHLEELRYDFDFWMKQDLTFLKWCDELHCVQIGDDYEELIKNSRGVQEELKKAKELNIPIKYIKYETNKI